MDSKYWDNVYKNKDEKEVSWFQERPTKSLDLIAELNLPKNASIIDIGGGESRLVDALIDEGFYNISILDISEVSLAKLKNRLSIRSSQVRFITSDITKFIPKMKYDLWHDRATFHFLTKSDDIKKYIDIVSSALNSEGYFVISTFSKTGPEKCSGLPISQYSINDLKQLFSKNFHCLNSTEYTHETPWGAKQNFTYCTFKKL